MPPKSKLAACIHCRQMKLRCDAHDTFPASCTRCEKRNLRCSIDPSFRRTAKRERVASLEQELQRLRENADSGISPPKSSIHDHVSTPEESAPVIPPPIPRLSTAESGWTFVTQTIDGIQLEPNAIAELFDKFYAHYHDRFPILADRETMARSYNDCPLLFWVIMAIVSQRIPEYTNLHTQLIAPVQRLATDVSASLHHPLMTVQALLLLCWWPLTLESNFNNPSWSYCGLATHTALQFGFHRPQYPSDFRYRDTLSREAFEARLRTWLACFIVNQTLSAFLGVPCTIHPDNTILSALKDANLPKSLQQHLEIALVDYRICHSLGQQGSVSTGLTSDPADFVRLYEAELKALNFKHESDWSFSAEIAYLKAYLDLFAFVCITALRRQQDSDGPKTGEEYYVVEASRTAERLIQVACRYSEEVVRWSTDVRTASTFAVFFLLKLLAVWPHLIDHVRAMNSVRQAWELYRQASQRKNDQYSRICSIVEYMSGVGGQDESFKTKMSVTSRAASNVLYDTVWAARLRFGQRVRDMRPFDYTLAAENEEASAQQLPSSGLPELEEDFIASLVGTDLLGWEYAFEGL
ncbi:hypothetical protein AC578_6964 [Pseudocercospora eumusae]|uniref:Zn(2)-C6 fungal-type domain-containing protein n=1 Tax=Pseudocercospora eumusae TaxID=321146 RepID=A0A139H9D1_9PEZI|nr:hypothetical protein AC578_6964 [Pseudocercospora eumusae]